MDCQNWREYNKQDNYESSGVDPCQTCKYHHYEKPQSGFDWASVWFGLLVICGIGCFVLWMHWQDAETKLKNCIYYNEYDGTVHSVKNGVDNELFDSDDLEEFDDLFSSASDYNIDHGTASGVNLEDAITNADNK